MTRSEPFAIAERRCLPWAPAVDFSQALVTNAPLVLTAGQGPFGADGSIVAVGDPAGQMRQTFQNLSTVLEAVGASLASVVSQTVYLARAEDFEVFKSVRREFYAPPFPAATTLRVDLLEPAMLIELTAVAAVGVERTER
ncbi:RidA family protein [Conexibacter woesei]|uniref:Endoribonuclease L-PSP n=1 Tax=Conexibacter woesei (strain DSM 14684 / CCUG 47730 / CIP 108061 / JCM 11494 / NBRC 100937 / ID131577) TaxID=469383 RepID=D3F6C7_CONWI|nr:RidA family protein [Conexibacter woesei]ADB50694.1 Endoribonuclease L-PSP [Conexibacter woesei DSM 14684]